MEERKSVLLLFGGQSSEHEVSCVSGAAVAECIDASRYDVLLVGITSDGRWLKAGSVEDIRSGAWRESEVTAALLPDADLKCALVIDDEGFSLIPVDIVFPVLHGLYGEDGCVQGLAELAQIPYVGCGVLASAAAMDKAVTKELLGGLGIPQTPYVVFRRDELEDLGAAAERVAARLGLPAFIKPANAGSSCGVTRAVSVAEVMAGLKVAAAQDCKVIAEAEVRGRELECALFSGAGGADVRASGVGEIIAASAFYDYDAKYNSSASRTVVEPELPTGAREVIRALAVKIFGALGCEGLARADFFLQDGTNCVIFNEINTMPGFTPISMYPKLWEAAGVPMAELVQRLLDGAAVVRRAR